MISSFRVQGYRKFTDFRLEDLGRINFLVGKNNVGKTTLLEAVYGWASGKNLSPFFWNGIQRNQYNQNYTAYHVVDNIVSSVNEKGKIPFSFSLVAVDEGKEIVYNHKISLGDLFRDFVRDVAMSSVNNSNTPMLQNVGQQSAPSNMFPANNVPIAQWEVNKDDEPTQIFLLSWPNLFIENIAPQKLAIYEDISSHRNMDENRKIYTYLKRQNLIKKFTEEMQIEFPEINDFDILPYQNNGLAPVSVQMTNGEYFPLHTFGDGFRRMFQIIGSLIFYHDNIMCIDEIDATVHPSAQKELSRCLIKYARKYNVQLFVTTHNLEFVDNFLYSWREDESLSKIDDIRIITMKDVNGEVKSRAMIGSKALGAREDFNLELR